jgi:hypothetical protein
MKTLFLNMKTKLFFATAFLLVGVISCKKDNTETTQTPGQTVDIAKLTDSISYTLDGVTYTCNVLTGEGGGNAGANLDTANGGWKWDVDTVQYRKNYTYSVSSSFMNGNGGSMTIHFIKKFPKAQLTRTVAPGIFGPVSDTLLYTPKGNHSYAVDFERFNTQNGIVLELGTSNGGDFVQIMRTYSVQSPRSPTTITNDSQKDSKFQITNIYSIPAYQGWWDCHLLEAKFSCYVYDKNEKPHLVNGYIRIHVD